MSYIIGDRVLCQTGDLWSTWQLGLVRSTQCDSLCEVELVVDQAATSAFKNHQMRICDFDFTNKLQLLMHHLHFNASCEVLTEICQTFGLNLSLIGHKLLLQSAACGNVEAFKWLVIDNNVDIKARDVKGRSIFQIAMINKHNNFIQFIVDCFNSGRLPFSSFDLLLMADNENQIFLHTLVVCDCIALSTIIFSNDDSKFMDFILAISKTTQLPQYNTPAHICIFQFKDKHGKWPIHYSTEGSETKDFLYKAAYQFQICLNCKLFLETMRLGTESVVKFLNEFVKDLVSQNIAVLFPCVERMLTRFAFMLCSEHPVDSGLQALAEIRKLDLSALQQPSPLMYKGVESYVFAPDLMTQLIRGPRTGWFHYPEIEPYLPVDADGRKYSISELNRIMKLCKIDLLRDWNGTDKIQFNWVGENNGDDGPSHPTIKNATSILDPCQLQCLHSVPKVWRDSQDILGLLAADICQHTARNENELLEQKMKMIDWLHHTLKMPLPPLHLFIEYDQLVLLVYVCDTYGDLLGADIQSDCPLYAYARTLDWWLPYAELCENLLVVGFLCLLGVVHDNMSCYQCLFENTRYCADVIMIQLMLELAAENNSYMFCKYIFTTGFVPHNIETYLSRGCGLNAAHIAAKNGYYELTLLLTQYYSPIFPCAAGHTVLNYAENSSHTAEYCDERLVKWAQEKQLLLRFNNAMQTVRSIKNSQIWKSELTKIDFVGTICDRLLSHWESIVAHTKRRNNMDLLSIIQKKHVWDNFTDVSQYVGMIFFFVFHMELSDVLAFIRDRFNDYFLLAGRSVMLYHKMQKFVSVLHYVAVEMGKSQSIQLLTKWNSKFTAIAKAEAELTEVIVEFVALLDSSETTLVELDSNIEKQKMLIKRTGLHASAFPGSYESLLLKDEGGSAVLKNSWHQLTFLHEAIGIGCIFLIEWLLAYRKHDGIYFCDGFVYAVSQQSLEVVQHMVQQGYTLFGNDENTRPIYHYALMEGYAESWRYYRLDDSDHDSDSVHEFLTSVLKLRTIVDIYSFTDYNNVTHNFNFIETAVSNLLSTTVSYGDTSRITEFRNCLDQYIQTHDAHNHSFILLVLKVLLRNIQASSALTPGNSKDLQSAILAARHQADNFCTFAFECMSHKVKIYEHEASIIEFLSNKYSRSLESFVVMRVVEQFVLVMGLDIQNIVITDVEPANKSIQLSMKVDGSDVMKQLARNKIEQRLRNKFIESLSDITLVEFIRKLNLSPELALRKYQNGRSLLHMAALHNRADICRYLLLYSADKNVISIGSKDGYDISVRSTALQAGASDAQKYLDHYLDSCLVVYKFVHNNWQSRAVRDAVRLKELLLVAIIRIQKVYRGHKPRRHFQLFCSSRRDNITAFYFVWSKLVNALNAVRLISSDNLQSWQSYKQNYDLLVSSSSNNSDSHLQSTIDTVSRSIDSMDLGSFDGDLGVFDVAAQHLEHLAIASDNKGNLLDETEASAHITANKCDNIELTQSVLKWLQNADSKYRAMFQNRIERLAEGDRSYALSKRLQGCSYPIFETKLDAGMRILWTAVRRDKISNLLVWYVSKHDDVGRLANNIVTANKRELNQRSAQSSSTSTTPAASSISEEFMELCDDDILLDPNGNCPLKIYTASRGDIPLLTTRGWPPALRLDNAQHDACSNSGTTLLLGRSGTGKTVCLSDRMTRDRLLYAMNGQQCNQLFVSRSRRLCELVKSFQQSTNGIDSACSMGSVVDFLTLDKFIAHMERTVNNDSNTPEHQFQPANRVDYQRFCGLMAVEIKTAGLDSVVIWTQIRSFLKGSLEALLCQLKHNKVLSAEEYCSEMKFAPDRCRLLPEQRRTAYAFYQQYQNRMTSDGLWDDADRVLDLLIRSKLQPLSACNGKGADYHKVYVDEVQDNTQAEILLYFLAAGMNTQSLFLAGDPAQSIVEGVDFRFEEVRAIVHELSNGTDRIDRPSKLFVNYRSHSGVLNCAAAVLDKLFAMFPGSAKVLPRDAGLFKGPRPAFFTAGSVNNLITLLSRNEGIVVLCHDALLGDLKVKLRSDNSGTVVNNTMLSIRAAKGMEYKDVLLLDFFGGIPETDHKAWKTLFSTTKLHSECQAYRYPQVESQLKLLYTAITRSCNRLIFAESAPSSVFSAFCRWMKSNELAEQFVPSADSAAVLMTADEWRVRGIEFALSAEADETEQFLSQAVHCFTCAGDKVLLSRAAVQRDLFHLHRKLLNRDVALSGDGNLQPREEMEIVSVLVRGVKHHFMEEVRTVCELLQTLVKEKTLFVQNIVHLLA